MQANRTQHGCSFENSSSSQPLKSLSAVLFSAILVVVAGCSQKVRKDIGDTVEENWDIVVSSVLVAAALKSDNDVVEGLGVIAGAYVAKKVIADLNEESQEKHTRAAQKTAFDGKTRRWENEETGASGKVTVEESYNQEEEQSVPVKKDAVDKVPAIEHIGKKYVATTAVNMRSGPSTDYKKVGGVGEGQRIGVIGKVEGKRWYMVQRDGVANGYIHANFLEPTEERSVTKTPEEVGESQNVETAETQMDSTCRKQKSVVTKSDGSVVTATKTVCDTPSGVEAKQA